MQGADSGGAPAGGEIIEVDAGAVGGIEEGPQAGGAEGGLEAEIGERVQQVGKTLIALLAGTGRDPQDCARAATVSGQNRSAGPALGRKHLGAGGHGEARRVESLLPDDGEFRTARVDDAAETDALFAALESERFGRGDSPSRMTKAPRSTRSGPFVRRRRWRLAERTHGLDRNPGSRIRPRRESAARRRARVRSRRNELGARARKRRRRVIR